MKMFTKLALVSSMAISANAMAMQSMDDAALSAATGQDGINIGIGISKIEIEKVLIHDNDGLNYANSSWSGAAPTSGNLGYGGTAAGTKAGAIVIKGDGLDTTAAVLYTASDAEVIAGTKVAGDVKTPAVPSITKNNGIVIGANYDNSGANLLASRNLVDLVIDTDGGTGTGNTAFLNIAAKVSGLNINIGEIGVSASKAAGTGPGIRRGANDTAYDSVNNTTGNYNAILSGLSLKTGKMDANIQLGAAPQGAMIILSTKMTGGLEIKNLGIIDNSTTLAAVTGVDVNGNGDYTDAGDIAPVAARARGVIQLDSIKVADASGADLTVNAKVSVVGEQGANKGYLRIITGSGATTPKTDMYIKGIHLGSATAASIGDVEVQGMQTYYSPSAGTYVPGAVITISGH